MRSLSSDTHWELWADVPIWEFWAEVLIHLRVLISGTHFERALRSGTHLREFWAQICDRIAWFVLVVAGICRTHLCQWIRSLPTTWTSFLVAWRHDHFNLKFIHKETILGHIMLVICIQQRCNNLDDILMRKMCLLKEGTLEQGSSGCFDFYLNELSKGGNWCCDFWLADKICTHVSNNTECRCGKKWGGSWRPSWDDHRWGCFFVTPNLFLLGIFCRIHIQLFLLFFFCYGKSASVIVPWTWQFFHSFPLLAGINCNGFFFLLENINALKQMRELRFAPFVRLEVDCEMPQDVIQRLSNELGLSNKDDVYTVCGQMALGG